MVDEIRLMIPLLETYNTEPNLAKKEKIDKRFHYEMVPSEDAHIYPRYVRDGHMEDGHDIALIILNKYSPYDLILKENCTALHLPHDRRYFLLFVFLNFSDWFGNNFFEGHY